MTLGHPTYDLIAFLLLVAGFLVGPGGLTCGGWTLTPLFAWYDLWVGAYFDRKLVVPCVGLVLTWPRPGYRKASTAEVVEEFDVPEVFLET